MTRLHPRVYGGWGSALALALLMAYGIGCAGLGKPSAAKSYVAVLTTYQGLAAGMAAYCAQPVAEPAPCIAARDAALEANEAIDATERARLTGGATDALYGAAALAINKAIPKLQKVQGVK